MFLALVYLLFVYLLASVPFGLVIATIWGSGGDIRTRGSGNIGASNVQRLHGWRLGLPTLLLDMGKGALPVWLGARLFPEYGVLWLSFIAVSAFCGHCFSAYLGFKGGKGVATSAGAMLALTPVPMLVALGVWAVLIATVKKASVASLAGTLTLVVMVGWQAIEFLPLAIALGLGIFVAHRSNIQRLVDGKENALREALDPDEEKADAAMALSRSPAGSQASATMAWPEE